MQTLAFTTGAIAIAIALFIGLTGGGNRRERIERFLIPSPLYLGAPICGLVLSGQPVPIAVAVTNAAIFLAALALVPLLVMVVALARSIKICR